jgi:hypothetical protein
MFNRIFFSIIVILALLTAGCATVLRGYEERVDLVNAPDDIKVFSDNGVEIQLSSREIRKSNQGREIKTWQEGTWKYEFQEIKSVSLRRNKEHFLILKSGDREKKVEVYPKITGTWLILDFITGIFPIFIDAYTGNWNHFESINAEF